MAGHSSRNFSRQRSPSRRIRSIASDETMLAPVILSISMHLRLPFSTQFTGVPTGFTGTRTIMLRRMMIGLVGPGRAAGGRQARKSVVMGQGVYVRLDGGG